MRGGGGCGAGGGDKEGKEADRRTGKKAHLVKVLVAKPDNLSSNPELTWRKKTKSFLKVVLPLPQLCHYMPRHTNKYM